MLDHQPRPESHVVIVDFERADYDALLLCDGELGWPLHFLGSGREALRDARAVRSAAWLVRVELPDMTGFDLVEMLRDRIPPTPVASLERARRIGVSQGLKFVYTGNLPGHFLEDTYCPRCGQSLIERFGFRLTRYNLTADKRCPDCGEDIPIVGEPMMPSSAN